MDLSRLFLRMARLARHPPSGRVMVTGLVVVAICVALVAIEAAGWWPDWLRAERVRGVRP